MSSNGDSWQTVFQARSVEQVFQPALHRHGLTTFGSFENLPHAKITECTA